MSILPVLTTRAQSCRHGVSRYIGNHIVYTSKKHYVSKRTFDSRANFSEQDKQVCCDLSSRQGCGAVRTQIAYIFGYRNIYAVVSCILFCHSYQVIVASTAVSCSISPPTTPSLIPASVTDGGRVRLLFVLFIYCLNQEKRPV